MQIVVPVLIQVMEMIALLAFMLSTLVWAASPTLSRRQFWPMMAMQTVLAVVMFSGCGARAEIQPPDYARVEGTPAGLRAYFDGTNGYITNGKASPDEDTAHWAGRRKEEQEITARTYAPSIVGEMFGLTPSKK